VLTELALLHQFPRCSASWRVRWALAIKGIPFTPTDVDILRNEHHEDDHRAKNPLTHVPALFIDGRWLAESVAILEYLEETRPEPALYPKDPWVRARVRQVVELVHAGIQPLQILVTQRRHSSDVEEQRAWVRFFNERGLAACEALLGTIASEIPGDGRFAVGDRLTAADLFLVPQLATSRSFGVDLTGFPRILAAESAALATEHARGALPESQAQPRPS
jgi:maleylacetoacetate isomerase